MHYDALYLAMISFLYVLCTVCSHFVCISQLNVIAIVSKIQHLKYFPLLGMNLLTSVAYNTHRR
jgi:hypothetical protein